MDALLRVETRLAPGRPPAGANSIVLLGPAWIPMRSSRVARTSRLVRVAPRQEGVEAHPTVLLRPRRPDEFLVRTTRRRRALTEIPQFGEDIEIAHGEGSPAA